MTIHIALLGPLRVHLDGAPQKLPKRRDTQRLWVYLLLHSGDTLARSAAAELLWPRAEKGSFNLRHALHELLKYLPEPPSGRPWLTSDRSTVCWNPGADCTLDVERFLAGSTGSDAETTVPELEAAAALYAGPLLDGWDEPWLAGERTRLAELFAATLLRISARHAAAGDAQAAVAAAQRLIEHDPYREESHQHLMRLYLAAGDRVAALNQYELCKTLLADELGAEPSLETAALAEQARQSESPSFAEGTAHVGTPAHPNAMANGASAGKGHGGVTLGRSGPAFRAPHFASAFVDDGHTTRLADAVMQARLVAVLGPPGAGKSRLAAAAVERMIDGGGLQRVVWVDLAREDVTDLGAGPQIAAAAAGQSTLLVLDNADSVLGAMADLAQDLLTLAPELRLLVTSRERLGIGGEQLYRLNGLFVPTLPAALEDLRASPGIRLFLERAVHLMRGGSWTRQDVLAAAEVCRRVEGLPLAIEVAATGLGHGSLQDLAQTLAHDLAPLLDAGMPTGVGRHATLGVAIASSVDDLPEAQRALLLRLAAFDDTFGVAAAEAACSGDAGSGVEVPEDDIVDGLERLVAKSLVIVDVNASAATRHRLGGVVCAFALRALAESGEVGEMGRRVGRVGGTEERGTFVQRAPAILHTEE